MSKFQTILVLIVLFVLFVPGLALAQDVPPTDPPPVLEVPTVEELLTAVEVTLTAILAGVIASPVTSAVVGLIKWLADRLNIGLIQNISGSQLNTIVVFILVGLVWLARIFGFTGELDSAFRVILALVPVLGGLAAGARASSGFYGNVTRNKVALIGYERPAEAAQRYVREAA